MLALEFIIGKWQLISISDDGVVVTSLLLSNFSFNCIVNYWPIL